MRFHPLRTLEPSVATKFRAVPPVLTPLMAIYMSPAWTAHTSPPNSVSNNALTGSTEKLVRDGVVSQGSSLDEPGSVTLLDQTLPPPSPVPVRSVEIEVALSSSPLTGDKSPYSSPQSSPDQAAPLTLHEWISGCTGSKVVAEHSPPHSTQVLPDTCTASSEVMPDQGGDEVGSEPLQVVSPPPAGLRLVRQCPDPPPFPQPSQGW